MNRLSETKAEEIKKNFQDGFSISESARKLGISRNTVRRHLREAGMAYNNAPEVLAVNSKEMITDFKFPLLERMFEAGKVVGENLAFKEEVIEIAKIHARELAITSYVDLIELEHAMMEWITYRRYYFKTIKASDDAYDGPYHKAYDKVVKASRGWRAMADKSLSNYERIIRQLEVKCGRVRADLGRGNIFINHQEVNN